jgi:uncharacterized protein
MTFDRNNVNQLFENTKYFIESGFLTIVGAPDFFTTDWEEEDFLIIESELKRIRRYIEKQKKHESDSIKISLIEDRPHSLGSCTAGESYYSIDVHGNIFPCTFLVGDKNHIIGDVLSGIDDAKLKRIKKILEGKVDLCANCAMSDRCTSSRCLFLNYATTKNYYTPNLVECNMMNIRYNAILESCGL